MMIKISGVVGQAINNGREETNKVYNSPWSNRPGLTMETSYTELEDVDLKLSPDAVKCLLALI